MAAQRLRNLLALALCLLLLLAAMDAASGGGHGLAWAALLPFLFLLTPPRLAPGALLIRPSRPRQLGPHRRHAGLRAPPQ